jgi:protein-S-isoprenylcysteine O-methyltransferase Ste14
MNYAHKSWWQIFEVVFGIPFIAAIIIQYFVPLSLPINFTIIGIIVGVVLFIIGVFLIIFARRELAQNGQPTDPGLPTSTIVTTGVFSISRNPLYLGGVCVLAGIAMVFNWPWVLLLLLPSIIACHYILIAPEERYLANKFGKEYLFYTASVHRWIGRANRNK